MPQQRHRDVGFATTQNLDRTSCVRKNALYFWIPACAGMTRFVVRGCHVRVTRGRPYMETKRWQTFTVAGDFRLSSSLETQGVIPAQAGIQKYRM